MPTKSGKGKSKKTEFEKKFEDVKKVTAKTAKEVEAKFKAKTFGIRAWWARATNEEKIYMILGIIALIIGLYLLLDLVLGMVFIIVGILFVTGFFARK